MHAYLGRDDLKRSLGSTMAVLDGGLEIQEDVAP